MTHSALARGSSDDPAARMLPAGTPEHIIVRDRLVELLDEAVRGSRLTLVCAPPGSGKTALVSMWATLRTTPGLLLWVSADGTHERRRTFWQRLALGLDGAAQHGHVPVLSVDRRSLAATTRRLARRGGPVLLVVDEGSRLPDPALHRELDGYLDQAGDAIRLVLVTRADPVLPLHRYRLAHALSEVRVEDLRFTPTESQDLFARADVEVTDAQVGRLLDKTGGWPAGLAFAADYLQGRQDVEGAVREFTGSDRAVSDFLVKEFLDAQPAGVREVLLRSSVADELPIGLFEELTGAPDGQAALAFLNRANAFLSPAPGSGYSYQYPPLLREFLRTRLAFEQPRLVPVLHDIAAQWSFRHGSVHEAVHHSVAAGRWDEAARYVVQGLLVGEVLNDRLDTLTTLRDMPASVHTAPAAVVRTALALRHHAPAQARAALAELRSTLFRNDAAATASDAGPDDGPDDVVLFCLELLETGIAALDHDTDGGLEAVRRAERHLHKLQPSRDTLPELRGLLATYRSRLLLWSGDVRGARTSLEEVAGSAQAARETAWEVSADAQRAVLAAILGDLDVALALAERADEERHDQVAPAREDRAHIAVARAWVMTERSLVGPARDQLARAEEAVSGSDPVGCGLIAVMRSRLLHIQGYYSAAHVAPSDAPEPAPAGPQWMADWDPVPSAAQVDGWQGEPPLETEVTRGILEADAALQARDEAAAARALSRALDLAAPQRMRRPFVEPPPAVRQLLRRREDLRATHAWLTSTESTARAGAEAPRVVPGRRVSGGAGDGGRTVVAPADASRFGTVLIEELTAKELEVLGHLADLHTTDEIAAAMFISVNTVRTHVRNVLRKLGVDRRNQAVRRAWELELLTESGPGAGRVAGGAGQPTGGE